MFRKRERKRNKKKIDGIFADEFGRNPGFCESSDGKNVIETKSGVSE